jgi:hypothetical protein
MTRLAPVLFLLFYSISVGLPFYYHTLAHFLPYPFFNAMSLTLVSIPLGMLLGYLGHGSQFLVSWTVPSSKTCLHVTISGLLYSATSSLTLICYKHSSTNFTVAFSFATVLVDAALRQESVSVPSIFGLLVILSGILTICHNFAWPTDCLSSSAQIIFQAQLAVAASGFALSVRKLTGIVSLFEVLPISFLNMWIHIVGVAPLIVAFCIIELPEIPKVAELFTFDYLQLLVFGVGNLELLSLCSVVLKDCSGFGFAEDLVQLKCISVFLISALAYADTAYTPEQAIGLFVIVLGYVLYSLVGERRAKGVAAGNGDTVALLSKQIPGVEEVNLSESGA